MNLSNFVLNFGGSLIMKRKSIYSLLVITILMGSLIPLQTQALADVIEWHSSLTIGTEVAWRITNQYLFDPADPHSLAGEDLWVGSVLSYEINDTLPVYYDDVYSTGMPPDFLKLYVNYKEISFFDIDGETEPSFALQYMILPYLFYPAASGETNNITQFLEHRAALDPNITAIDYYMIGGYYIRVSIYNDFMSSFQITINNNTGIVSDFFIEDDFGELYGQLDIWESDIDDAGVAISNTLNFHSNLVAGTELAWQYTEITYESTASDVMKVNNVTLAVGHVFSLDYATLPVDPLEYYGGNYSDPSISFFDVFFEGDPAVFDHITRAQQVLWVTLTNPLSCTLYNLSLVSMEDIHIIRDFNDPGITNTLVNTVGDIMNLEFDFIEENDNWVIDLEINVNSGIVETMAIDVLGFVHFEMEFYPTNSSLLIDGSENPDYPPGEDDGEPTKTLLGFNWFYLFISAIVVLPIIRRRKK